MGSPDPTVEEATPKERTQPHLMAQDASKVDPTKLTALTPEVVGLSSSVGFLRLIYSNTQ